MKILYCTDFSDAARFSVERALPFLKPRCEADIISVIEPRFKKIKTYKKNKIENLEKMQSYLESKGLIVCKKFYPEGDPAETVLKQARKKDYDLIIAGSRRETWIKWLGSTSRKIVSKAQIPVFIAKNLAGKNHPGKKDILFTVDGSENAYNSVKKALKLINFDDSSIEVLFVKEGKAGLPVEILSDEEWTKRMLEQEAENAREVMQKTVDIFSKNGINNVSQKILEGDAATEIMQYAEKQGKQLIVMGSHGREGISSLLLGSVSKRVLDHGGCPVIIVPAQKSNK